MSGGVDRPTNWLGVLTVALIAAGFVLGGIAAVADNPMLMCMAGLASAASISLAILAVIDGV